MDYDYIIIGAGAAGLHLALAMLDDDALRNKRVLILDREAKEKNDRTWCFWEEGTGRWDEIVTFSWDFTRFITSENDFRLSLSPYKYKMVRSRDFYSLARKKITRAESFKWITAGVEDVIRVGDGHLVVVDNGERYSAQILFDSRVDEEFYSGNDDHFKVWQHFKGWQVETSKPVFNPEEFVMMDFRVKYKNTTSFTYILPISPTSALVEYTLFSKEILPEKAYEEALKSYFNRHLSGTTYNILEEEKGVIPMSDYSFHSLNTSTHIKIGTAGSWVKPSSGYSFRNAERYSRKVVENLKKDHSPDKGIISRRHRFYDRLFLDQLYYHNDRGEALFNTMYSKNRVQDIFRFLDEETTFYQELRIMNTFTPWPFMAAIYRAITRE